MATLFDRVEKDFYTAFFIPDPAKRRAALDEWVKTSTPIIQATVREELKVFIENRTNNCWTEDRWRYEEKKWRQQQNEFHLVMDIQLRPLSPKEVVKGVLPAPVIRKTEIDLHGKMVDEAIQLVDRFLQESYLAHECRLWIIHGKGTGALRQAVEQHLKGHRLVVSFAPADGSHGGEGATQVDIIDRRDQHLTTASRK